MKIRWKVLIIALICPFIAALIGSIFTTGSVDTWYKTINKPVFTPPNWLFAPAWTTLYLLMGVSSYIIYVRGDKRKTQTRTALYVYVASLIINALWSVLFFGVHLVFIAFIELIILLAMVLTTILLYRKISKPAAYLQIPYLLWTTFAGVLNFAVFWLNK